MKKRGGRRSEPWSLSKSGSQREEKEPAQRAEKLPVGDETVSNGGHC